MCLWLGLSKQIPNEGRSGAAAGTAVESTQALMTSLSLLVSGQIAFA